MLLYIYRVSYSFRFALSLTHTDTHTNTRRSVLFIWNDKKAFTFFLTYTKH